MRALLLLSLLLLPACSADRLEDDDDQVEDPTPTPTAVPDTPTTAPEPTDIPAPTPSPAPTVTPDPATLTDDDQDGFSEVEGDCDDVDWMIYPGAGDACDEVDNDCDELVDEDGDSDGDGWSTCEVENMFPDCDDSDPAVHPGAREVCDNDKNDDCYGTGSGEYQTMDQDDDDFPSCVPAGSSTVTDCDDGGPLVNPGVEYDPPGDGGDFDCDGYDD